MDIVNVAAKVNWDMLYLGVVGSSTVISVAHYILNYKKLVADVPIHYDYLGRPDNYVGKRYFILYPVMTALCGVIGYGIRPGTSTPIRASDQISTRVAIAASMAMLIVCQYYAGKISEGKARKLPQEYLLGAFSVIGSCGLYSFLNGTLNR